MMLNGEEYNQLHQALLSAFPEIDSLRLMVRTGLSENLNTISEGTNLSNTTFKLIEWAISEGRLEELVTQAYKAKRRNPELRRFAEQFLSIEEKAENISSQSVERDVLQTSTNQQLSPTSGSLQIYFDLNAIRQRYLHYVSQRWANLEMRGITQAGKEDSFPLDEIYVSLTAEQEREHMPELPDLGEFIPADLGVDRVGASQYQQYPVTSAEARHFLPRRDILVENISLPNAVRENRHLVILGDPGSGKTTLARFLTRCFALASLDDGPSVRVPVHALPTSEHPTPGFLPADDYGELCLPILLRVADFAEALDRNGNLRLSDFLPYARGEANISETETAALFEKALKAGHVLVILDGLDEVSQTADRATIARKIDDFVNGIGAQNRVVVTSRKDGYPATRLDTRFALITIRDMEQEQIERFVTRRMMAHQRSQAPGASETELYMQAQPDITSILHDVRHNEGVKRLAVNPLLLTVLCLIHRKGKQLPNRRVELYESASQTLLEEWRSAQTGRSDSVVSMTEADRLLAPLAYWMHERVERGRIQRNTAIGLLREIYADRHGLTKSDPKVEDAVDSFWRRLTYETSVFVERSQGEYAFLHLTFEEYWAARYWVRDSQAAERLREKRHNPRFTEVILLAIASQTEENAANLVRRSIWCPEASAGRWGYQASALEEILHRDLLLAARCLEDCAGIESSLAREVAEEMVAICLNRDGKGVYGLLVTRVREVLARLKSTEVGAASVHLLLQALTDKELQVRLVAIEILGLVGQGSSEAVKGLLEVLKDQEKNIRYTATVALGTAGQGSKEVVQALLDILKNDEDSHIRREAARSLSIAGQGSEQVIPALITALKDRDTEVRIFAARELGTFCEGHNDAILALIDALHDNEFFVQWEAAAALAMAAPKSKEASEGIITALKNGGRFVKMAMAMGLARTEKGSADVIQELISVLHDEAPDVRRAAAQALGAIGKGSLEVCDALLIALYDPDITDYPTAAEALGIVGQGLQEIIPMLLSALRNANIRVRCGAAHALGVVGKGSEEVIKGLISVLDDSDRFVRYEAMRALGSAGQGSEEALQAILARLTDEDPLVRQAAIGALGTVGAGSKEAARTLIAAVEDNSSRSWAVGALGQAGQGSEEAVHALVALLTDSNDDLRQQTVVALGTAGQGSTEAVNGLLQALKDENKEVRRSAAGALATIGQGSPEATNGLLQALQDKDRDVGSVAWEGLWNLYQKEGG